MYQIYEGLPREMYLILVDKTCKMWKDGKKTEEIAAEIKQPLSKVCECITFCKTAIESQNKNIEKVE